MQDLSRRSDRGSRSTARASQALAFSARIPSLFIAALVFITSAVSPTPTAAQFLQTDVYTIQLPHPSVELDIITTPKGLFVACVSPRIGPLNSFDPRELKIPGSLSLFLEYGNNSQVPEHLILPSTTGVPAVFNIRGTFTIGLCRDVRVSVAMNNNSIPYVTVAYAGSRQASLAGFVGTQLVVNLGRVIDTLEADPLQKLYGDITGRYELDETNTLTLMGRPVVPGRPIGLGTPPNNKCLFEGVFLTNESLAAYDKLANPMALRTFEARQRRTLSLSSFLTLNVSQLGIAAIDYDTGALMLIKETMRGGEVVCSVEPLSISPTSGSTLSLPANESPVPAPAEPASPPARRSDAAHAATGKDLPHEIEQIISGQLRR